LGYMREAFAPCDSAGLAIQGIVRFCWDLHKCLLHEQFLPIELK